MAQVITQRGVEAAKPRGGWALRHGVTGSCPA